MRNHFPIGRWVGSGKEDKYRWWAVWDCRPCVPVEARFSPICLRKTKKACENFSNNLRAELERDHRAYKRRLSTILKNGSRR